MRSDNEPVLKGEDGPWKRMCRELNILPVQSVPFEPEMNGRVERWHRVLGDSLRAVLSGVDKLVWDWAARHVAYCYNRVRRKKDVPTPYFRRFRRAAKVGYLRRFGCMAFAKIHEKTGVL